tara:strand:- start:5 stop:1135 length:1131 start_codon:yes stop_codon:yes gene_type:complete
MAIYKIFPTKDASIYTLNVEMNTGLDPIIEASTTFNNGDSFISRYLIKFSTEEIIDVFNNKIKTNPYQFNLVNYLALADGLNKSTELYFYPVSGSWDMGTGLFADNPRTTNGVSWESQTTTNKWATSSFNDYATASYGSLKGGGCWYTGSNLGLNVEQTKEFQFYGSKDINVDVTNTIRTWYSNSIDPSNGFPNDGFLVKQGAENEFNIEINNTHILRYFSMDTNTIYPPSLECKWDDSTFNTGSSPNKILTQPETFISVYNNKETYYPESIARFRLAAIPKYPDRTFITASYYTENFYLPENDSLYAIKDTETNEYIIDFDSNFTKISADATSSYFDLYMNGLEPERYYTILVQSKIGSATIVFDEGINFKVINP